MEHSFILCGKLRKKNSVLSLFCRACLLSSAGWNATPYLLNGKSRLARSHDIDGLVRARNIVSFSVSSYRERASFSPLPSNHIKTLAMSQVDSTVELPVDVTQLHSCHSWYEVLCASGHTSVFIFERVSCKSWTTLSPCNKQQLCLP